MQPIKIKCFITVLVLLVVVLMPSGYLHAAQEISQNTRQGTKQINSRYVTITYTDVKSLRTFNDKLYMGNLRYLLKGKKSETIEDEVKNKIDLIIEKVETVLDMYPAKLKFNIVIHSSTTGIQMEYQRLYKRIVNYIAFYSPGENTVFYSANNAKLRVVTHEIGHVIAENYFAISPPPKIHEVLAQYAEMHISD